MGRSVISSQAASSAGPGGGPPSFSYAAPDLDCWKTFRDALTSSLPSVCSHTLLIQVTDSLLLSLSAGISASGAAESGSTVLLNAHCCNYHFYISIWNLDCVLFPSALSLSLDLSYSVIPGV